MELKKDDRGRFTILQLTDLHIGSVPYNELDQRTFSHIIEMVNVSDPDLIVISGDLISGDKIKMEDVPDPQKSYDGLIDVLNDLNKPITITYGNHDTEGNITRTEVREMEKKIHHLVEKKHLHVIEDRESYCLEITNRNGEVSNVLYLIDSGNRDPLNIGTYEFVHPDQVTWFNGVSKLYNNRNRDFKRDLLFLHIPLPEYKEAYECGKVNGYRYEEEISSPMVNTGLYSSLLLNGHVAGVFCGHDHDNDFVAEYQGMRLCYGRVSGFNSYGELKRGARVIELFENQSFDTHIIE